MIAVKEEVLRLAGPEDMETVRAIVQDPSIAPTFGPLPTDLDNFAVFMAPGIVFGAEIRADHSVYTHLAVLPWARGRRAIEAMRWLVAWFFTNTPCPRVSGWTPSTNRAGFMFNRLCGARRRGEALGRTLFSISRAEWERGS